MSGRRPAKTTWGGAPAGASGGASRTRLVRIGPAANDNRRAWALRVAALVAALGAAIWALIDN